MATRLLNSIGSLAALALLVCVFASCSTMDMQRTTLTSDPGMRNVARGGFSLSDYMLLNSADRRAYEDLHQREAPAPLAHSNGLQEPWMAKSDLNRQWYWADKGMLQFEPIWNERLFVAQRPF